VVDAQLQPVSLSQLLHGSEPGGLKRGELAL
jgi:hypothetical protein